KVPARPAPMMVMERGSDGVMSLVIGSRGAGVRLARLAGSGAVPLGPARHRACKAQDVRVGVVERGGRDADDVGFAPVADDALAYEVLEQGATAVAAADDAQRKLAATLGRVARGDHLQGVAQARVDQGFEV